MLNSMNLAAAALTATGLLVSEVRDEAASYTTVAVSASRRSKIRRRYRPYIRINSQITVEKACCHGQYLILRIADGIFPYELELHELEKFVGIGYTIESPVEVI